MAGRNRKSTKCERFRKYIMFWRDVCAGIEKARSTNDSVNTLSSPVKNITFTVPEKSGKEKGGKNDAAEQCGF